MANTIVITKTSEGVVLVNNGGKEYTLLPDYKLQKNANSVKVLTDLGGLIDTFTAEDVEKVVLIDGSEVIINDLDILFTQLRTNFFFVKTGLIGPTKDLEFISDVNTLPGQDGNYRLKMVAGKLQTQKRVGGVFVALEEI